MLIKTRKKFVVGMEYKVNLEMTNEKSDLSKTDNAKGLKCLKK